MAEVANDSELRVLVETIDGVPSAIVRFLAFDFDEDDLDDMEDEAVTLAWEVDEEDEDLDEADRLALFDNADFDDVPIVEVPAEALELGTYTDFDRLFDVLGLVSEQALDWEAQLVSFDDEDYEEPDVYDIFGEDDGDEEEDYFDNDDADVDDESEAEAAEEK